MSDALEGAPAKVTGALGKKLGPFPGIVWVAIVLAGAYGFNWYRKRKAAPVTATDQTSTAPYQGADAGGYPGLNNGTGSVGTGTAPPAIATNAQWGASVVNRLTGTGQYKTSDVNNAVANYLNGMPLSSTEQAIIDAAITGYGVPPEGVLPINTAPVDTKTVARNGYWANLPSGGAIWGEQLISADGSSIWRTITDQQSANGVNATGVQFTQISYPDFLSRSTSTNSGGNAARSYTVRKGDTLNSIATTYYGTPNGAKIAAANNGISDPLTTGQTLNIPY